MKITSPAEGYTAKDRYGDVVLDFQDGVAEHDGDLPDGLRQYLAGAGYGLGSKKPTQPEPIQVPDPRDYDEAEVVGTKLRDAAVDPRPEDFLPPINAGEANPHGPNVVSPEIHASGPAGIRPGNVHVDDPAKQEVRETEYAKARLIEQVTASEAVKAEIGDLDDHGPIGMSDPGSVKQGIEAAEHIAAAEKVQAKSDEPTKESAAAPNEAATPKKSTTAKKAATPKKS